MMDLDTNPSQSTINPVNDEEGVYEARLQDSTESLNETREMEDSREEVGSEDMACVCECTQLKENETFPQFFTRVGSYMVKKPNRDPIYLTSRSVLTVALSYVNLVNKANVQLKKAEFMNWLREVEWLGSGVVATKCTDEELDQRLKYAYTYRLAGKPSELIDTTTSIQYAPNRGAYCAKCFTGFECNRRCGHADLPILYVCKVDYCGVACHACCLDKPHHFNEFFKGDVSKFRRSRARAKISWYCPEHNGMSKRTYGKTNANEHADHMDMAQSMRGRLSEIAVGGENEGSGGGGATAVNSQSTLHRQPTKLVGVAPCPIGMVNRGMGRYGPPRAQYSTGGYEHDKNNGLSKSNTSGPRMEPQFGSISRHSSRPLPPHQQMYIHESSPPPANHLYNPSHTQQHSHHDNQIRQHQHQHLQQLRHMMAMPTQSSAPHGQSQISSSTSNKHQQQRKYMTYSLQSQLNETKRGTQAIENVGPHGHREELRWRHYEHKDEQIQQQSYPNTHPVQKQISLGSQVRPDTEAFIGQPPPAHELNRYNNSSITSRKVEIGELPPCSVQSKSHSQDSFILQRTQSVPDRPDCAAPPFPSHRMTPCAGKNLQYSPFYHRENIHSQQNQTTSQMEHRVGWPHSASSLVTSAKSPLHKPSMDITQASAGRDPDSSSVKTRNMESMTSIDSADSHKCQRTLEALVDEALKRSPDDFLPGPQADGTAASDSSSSQTEDEPTYFGGSLHLLAEMALRCEAEASTATSKLAKKKRGNTLPNLQDSSVDNITHVGSVHVQNTSSKHMDAVTMVHRQSSDATHNDQLHNSKKMRFSNEELKVGIPIIGEAAMKMKVATTYSS
eukprot:CFRG2788T1